MCGYWRYSWFPIQRLLGLDPLSLLTLCGAQSCHRIPVKCSPTKGKIHLSFCAKSVAHTHLLPRKGYSRGKPLCEITRVPGMQCYKVHRPPQAQGGIWTPSQYWPCCAKGWLSDPRARDILLYLLLSWSDRLEASSLMPSSKKKTKIKRLSIHQYHSLYQPKWQQKAMNWLKNPQDMLYTKKSSERDFLHFGSVFSSLSIEKSSFGKDGWRVSRSVFNFIHLSFFTGIKLQNFTFYEGTNWPFSPFWQLQIL